MSVDLRISTLPQQNLVTIDVPGDEPVVLGMSPTHALELAAHLIEKAQSLTPKKGTATFTEGATACNSK